MPFLSGAEASSKGSRTRSKDLPDPGGTLPLGELSSHQMLGAHHTVNLPRRTGRTHPLTSGRSPLQDGRFSSTGFTHSTQRHFKSLRVSSLESGSARIRSTIHAKTPIFRRIRQKMDEPWNEKPVNTGVVESSPRSKKGIFRFASSRYPLHSALLWTRVTTGNGSDFRDILGRP